MKIFLKTMQKTISFTLGRQIYTIVVNSGVRKKRLNELNKEYQQNLIEAAIHKARSMPIKNLTTSKTKTDSKNLTSQLSN